MDQVNNLNGGPAFPVNLYEVKSSGLSMRDFFAAAAIYGAAGQLSQPDPLAASDIARWAYELADAMLEARQR